MRSFEEHDVVNTVNRVADGAETLDYLFRRGEYIDPKKSPRPNLILLDLRMPRVDGLEVLGEIKTSDMTRWIPVVVLTSSEAE
jgi:CheY-like chemotaxis protein